MFITCAIATTGTNPETDYIIGLATDGDIQDFRIYQCPSIIPSSSIKHHHITAPLSAWGAPSAQIIVDMQNIIAKADEAGIPLVMNNAAWTWAFLQSAAERHLGMSLEAPVAGVIDVQVLHQLLTNSQFKCSMKQMLDGMGYMGAVPTDPRGIAYVLVGATLLIEGTERFAGADLAELSASAYQEQAEQNEAYRKAQSLSYRPILPYPSRQIPALI